MDGVSLRRVEQIQAGTHARIDLDRYEENIRVLREIAGPAKTFMAVVKANAYGHGAVACAHAAARAGAEYLAVARVSEGLQLRRAGITLPILILGGPNLAQVEDAVHNNLTVSVGAVEALDAVQRAAQSSPTRPRIHLKLDTGLHRYGALEAAAVEIAERCLLDDRIELEGAYAHFSSADESTSGVTDAQIARAGQLVRKLNRMGIALKYIHLPNSAAILSERIGESNLVRAGIAGYGLSPSRETDLPARIKPVLSIWSTLTRTFTLPAGEGVSYGLTYLAEHDEQCATVPIGYGDGLPRSTSNRGWFIVNGERCVVHGRVSMDQTVVGLKSAADVGDEVTIVGDPATGAMTLDDLATMDGTINYEIATRITARVPRLYYREGIPVAWDDLLLGESSGA